MTAQEQARVSAQAQGSGKRALVIGGRGKMGAWFAEFLASQGLSRRDRRSEGRNCPASTLSTDWHNDALDHDLIVLATPLGELPQLLQVLAAAGAARSDLRSRLFEDAAARGLGCLGQAAGCRVTSLHPMFGPDTELAVGPARDLHRLGPRQALAEAQELFAPTMAERVVMDLDEHDRLIAYVLGLSHALNIAFFTALGRQRRGGPAAGENVEHYLRFAAGSREPRRRREPRAVFRDPKREPVRRRIAAGLAEGRCSAW